MALSGSTFLLGSALFLFSVLLSYVLGHGLLVAWRNYDIPIMNSKKMNEGGRSPWLAMGFGCCASRDDVVDEEYEAPRLVGRFLLFLY